MLFCWLGSDPERNRIVTWARLEGREPWPAVATKLQDRVQAKFIAAQRAGLIKPDIDIVAALVAVDALFKGYWERREVYCSAYSAPDLDQHFLTVALRIVISRAAKRALKTLKFR